MDRKLSAAPIGTLESFAETDTFLYLDKSDTTHEQAGPEGTWKQGDVNWLRNFGTQASVVHFLNLSSIDTDQPWRNYIADAINARGPFAGEAGKNLIFRTYQLLGSDQSDYTTIETYYELTTGALNVGGGIFTAVADSIMISGGPYAVNPEENADLFIDLGTFTGSVVDKFNEGNPASGGDAWVIDGEQLIVGVDDGEAKIWRWTGGDGQFGGNDSPDPPDIRDAVEADFLDLATQTGAPPSLESKPQNGNLAGTPAISLDNHEGRYYNMASAATAATFTFANEVLGGKAFLLIDTTGKTAFPTLTSGRLLNGDKFEADQEFLGTVFYDGVNANIRWNKVGEQYDDDIDETYADYDALIIDQNNQIEGESYWVTDASDFTGITSGGALVYYRGTTVGDETDYLILSKEEDNEGAGGGISFSNNTGTTIDFTENAAWNAETYLTSGDLTLDLTSSVAGTVQVVYCDSYIPSISGETFLYGSGTASASALNIYSLLYDGFNITVNISAIVPLDPPVLDSTPGDEQADITWSTILNADNYVLERDTDSGFGSSTEIYSGSDTEYNDTGLTNSTTYYYRVRAQGNGYFESGWSETESVTPTSGSDPDLLAYWDANNDGSVTTANGLVTQWDDLTANGHDLTEATRAAAHSSANDWISFTGGVSTHDMLSKVISSFEFQQSDDFSIVVKGLSFDSAGNGGNPQIPFNNRESNAATNGWYVQLAADGNTLFWAMSDGSTQNFASYAPGSSLIDSTQRDFILINDSGDLKIYDATNTNVGTNGTTSISTIDYSSTTFKIGAVEVASPARPWNGVLQSIKVYSRALSSGERDTELGL